MESFLFIRHISISMTKLSDQPEVVRDVFILSVLDKPKDAIANELDIEESRIDEILQDMEVAAYVQHTLQEMINEVSEVKHAS